MTSRISDAQRRVLDEVAAFVPEGTYLAGGVAVALTLGHRTSVDLDLFVPADFDPERLEERLVTAVERARITGRARGTLHLEVDGIPVSVLSYRYPALAPATSRPGIGLPVAAMEDLLCMKLSAIAGRGAAKDFWDLDEMLTHGVAHGSLDSALQLFTRKYPAADTGHVVRALVYFAEADASTLPVGLHDAEWKAIKARFVDRIRAL